MEGIPRLEVPKTSDLDKACELREQHSQRVLEVLDLDREGAGFPTFGVCVTCGGYKEAYCKGKTITDPLVVLELAMLQHGYYLAKWPKNVLNREHIPHPCFCACDHRWRERNIGRCLHEWTCEKCGLQIQVDSSD